MNSDGGWVGIGTSTSSPKLRGKLKSKDIKVKVKSFSHVRLFATPRTALQADALGPLVAQTVKHLSINVGDLGSIPGSVRFPGEGNDNPLHYSHLEDPMDGGAWCRLLSMGSQRVGHD